MTGFSQEKKGERLGLGLGLIIMVLLSNEAFLLSLKGLYESQSSKGDKGTVFLTQKMVIPHGTKESVCLYRATDGAHKKFSTRVVSGESLKFHPLLMNLMKSSMGKLRRVEKKKEKEGKKKPLVAALN